MSTRCYRSLAASRLRRLAVPPSSAESPNARRPSVSSRASRMPPSRAHDPRRPRPSRNSTSTLSASDFAHARSLDVSSIHLSRRRDGGFDVLALPRHHRRRRRRSTPNRAPIFLGRQERVAVPRLLIRPVPRHAVDSIRLSRRAPADVHGARMTLPPLRLGAAGADGATRRSSPGEARREGSRSGVEREYANLGAVPKSLDVAEGGALAEGLAERDPRGVRCAAEDDDGGDAATDPRGVRHVDFGVASTESPRGTRGGVRAGGEGTVGMRPRTWTARVGATAVAGDAAGGGRDSARRRRRAPSPPPRWSARFVSASGGRFGVLVGPGGGGGPRGRLRGRGRRRESGRVHRQLRQELADDGVRHVLVPQLLQLLAHRIDGDASERV